ncbi:monovalent cation/H+ antiporter subunit A [Psychromonas sp.]|uniref:monovalent cation/H+ antiporter subunit A n=1 Tax=Psychromonas sp. TaxID=1884585 RepID=UPI003564C52D
MKLFLLCFLPIIGVIVPILAKGFGRSQIAFFTALLPSVSLALLFSEMFAVFDGAVISHQIAWVSSLGLNLSLRLDGLAFLFATLILGIGLLVILYARYYLSERDNMSRFYSYLILFMAAMLGVVLSGNLIQMWFFWEMTSISSFLLISFWNHKSEARKGARLALTVTGFGGLCLLAGVILIGETVGSYELDVVLNAGDLIRTSSYYPQILILVLLGAFTKSAQFPFHFWLPHAMAAPTPVSAYLHSATMVKAGVFLLARLYPALSGTDMWFVLVTTTGLMTLLYGAYTAVFQHDLKGLLAYSTISHLGLITLLFGLNRDMAAVAAVFHIINHATFKASLFMGAGIIDHESGSRDMRKLNGLYRYMPITATLAMVAAAAMAGVPLLNGFLSKEMFFAEVLEQRTIGAISWLIPVLATVGAALSVAYSLRFIHDVFFNGEPRDLPKTPHEPPRYMRVPVEVLVAICLLVGAFPAFTIGALLNSAGQATINNAVPEFSLAIWHGFNIPLLMSFIAIVGGVLIYMSRKHLFRFQASFQTINASEIFDKVIHQIQCGAQKVIGWIDNGSYQRSAFILAAFALLMLAIPISKISEPLERLAHTNVEIPVIVGCILLILGSIATVLVSHQRIIALAMLSLVGLVVSIAFNYYSAPDLALTQVLVEVVAVILLLLTLYFFPQTTPSSTTGPAGFARDILLASTIGAVIGTVCLLMLTYHSESVSQFYIDNAKTGGGGTNVVNVILVDFRGFDTMGEILVLGIAALGIYKLIARMRLSIRTRDAQGRLWSEDKHPMILSVVSQSLLPLALLISAYIFLRGHNLPGGGFIAGLITAVAMILQYFAHGVSWVIARNKIVYQSLIVSGLMIALLTGMAPLFWGYPFLTTWFDYFTLPVIGKFELTSALVFDLGVYLTVVGSTMLILSNLGKLTTNQRLKVKER